MTDLAAVMGRLARSLVDQPRTRILVAAGAGMSIPAGIDYTDPVLFAQRYPAMVRRGYRCMYELVGNPDLARDPLLMWGYYGEHAYWMRYQCGEAEVYTALREAVGQHEYFVWTTNVDGMFEKNGFDPARIYTMQGDFQYLQCLRSCTPQSVWPSHPTLEAIARHVDKSTQRLPDASLVPKCPQCGGPAMLNVRGGPWFLEEHFLPQRERVMAWLQDAEQRGDPVLVLEIGAGFNTPGCIRYPMMRLAARSPHVTLVRINLDHAEIEDPHVPPSRGISLPVSALDAVRALREALRAARGPSPTAGSSAP